MSTALLQEKQTAKMAERLENVSLVGARQGDSVVLVREPHNPRDSNCVAVFLRGGAMLGHVAKEAAEWLSPMLLGPFRITG